MIGRSLQLLLMSKMTAVMMTTLAGLLISGVAATIKTETKFNVGLDKAYTEGILFKSPVRSKLHCAVLCNQHDCCETFTFDQKVCLGHAVMVTSHTSNASSTPAPGARSYSRNIERKPKNCADTLLDTKLSESGVVTIYPEDDNTPLQVYCDQDTDGGGWLVFQRRQDGSVDFNRTWTEYQNGFGELQGEFWLGLDALHVITSLQKYELCVNLMKFDGTKGNATYSDFIISSSSDNYRLDFDRFTGGVARDELGYFKSEQFFLWNSNNISTKLSYQNIDGGWWNTRSTVFANLNGLYKSHRTMVMTGYFGLSLTVATRSNSQK